MESSWQVVKASDKNKIKKKKTLKPVLWPALFNTIFQ